MVKYQRDLPVAELVKNDKGIKILTDSGFSDFDGVIKKGTRDTVCVELDDGKVIYCTPDHEFLTEAMVRVAAKDLSLEHNIIVKETTAKVKNISQHQLEEVYDIYNVHQGNRFYANGVLVSNCEFIIFEETLIDQLMLVDMQGVDPAQKIGQVRWYKYPDPNSTYVVSLDPSTGTGGDYAAIQVIEMPSMMQIAEWQHNKTPVEGQVKCMMEILRYLEDFGCSSMYWSVENNSIGEGALVVIRDTGEESFPGEMLHDPHKVAGRRGRLGFHTTAKSKLEACLSLKRYIETGKLRIYSKVLIKELKGFVAKGQSFAAKPGEHDDTVMALVLAIRMINYIATFEDTIYDVINSNLAGDALDDYLDEFDSPMPVSFL
jgi:hypothetical protein